MENGIVMKTEEGSPQGGNLSPLLANIYWAAAGSGILTHTITNKRLAHRGYYDISEAYKSLHYL